MTTKGKQHVDMTRKVRGRRMKETEIKIKSKDFWVNIVDFLQQYWAVIENNTETDGFTVYFLHEGSGVFAQMNFETEEIAKKALSQNGFKSYNDPLENFGEYLNPPKEPFYLIKNRGRSMAT